MTVRRFIRAAFAAVAVSLLVFNGFLPYLAPGNVRFVTLEDNGAAVVLILALWLLILGFSFAVRSAFRKRKRLWTAGVVLSLVTEGMAFCNFTFSPIAAKIVLFASVLSVVLALPCLVGRLTHNTEEVLPRS